MNTDKLEILRKVKKKGIFILNNKSLSVGLEGYYVLNILNKLEKKEYVVCKDISTLFKKRIAYSVTEKGMKKLKKEAGKVNK